MRPLSVQGYRTLRRAIARAPTRLKPTSIAVLGSGIGVYSYVTVTFPNVFPGTGSIGPKPPVVLRKVSTTAETVTLKLFSPM